MTIKMRLLVLVEEQQQKMAAIPELQEFFGYLIDELHAVNDYELENYFCNSKSEADILRIVAWQSIPINIEFSERFTDEVLAVSFA
ncbi:hypothetical protein L1D28_05640 [Vibrio chagasii]|uniref:hypothetical protein n=1 Tax=Vibrio chagasii TaxID=170679 RepID=UPI001EFE9FC3|nr:hypothetical protein [Vibrio chagasii]MCG9561125.1 hypothetical protein [Vibrio chagasii]